MFLDSQRGSATLGARPIKLLRLPQIAPSADVLQTRHLPLDCPSRVPIHILGKLNRNRDWVLTQVDRFVRKALDAGYAVSVGCEDASRADPAFLGEVAETAQRAGAMRIRSFCLVGILKELVYQLILRGTEYPPDVLVDAMLDLLTEGLFTDAFRPPPAS